MKETKDFVFFWRGPFSNWHNVEFTDPITGVKFYNTEQAFMWYKADFFKDLHTREQIEAEKDPQAVKKLGRAVKNYNEEYWVSTKFGFMAYVNLLKYSQHSDLAELLLETGTKMLVEASPYDKIWGIGLSEDDPRALDMRQWQGANLLGLVLTTIRLHLVKRELDKREDEDGKPIY